MKKNFYYDLFILNENLIDDWIKYFFWPVTPQKTQNILNKILDIYFKIVEEEKNQFLKVVLLHITILGIHTLCYITIYCSKNKSWQKNVILSFQIIQM